VKLDEKDYLAHYGTLRKSGRYPWGSGGSKYQGSSSFLAQINEMKRNGMSDTEIAKSFSRPDAPYNTSNLRADRSLAINEERQGKINHAQRLRDKGLSNSAIGREMGINESSVRALLEPGAQDKADILTATSDMLRRQVEEKGAIDIGTQVEKSLPLDGDSGQLIGISSTKFNTAVAVLQKEGYKVHYVKVKQIGTGELTTMKVLAKPDDPEVAWSKLVRDPARIKPIAEHSPDGGRTYEKLRPPTNVNSKRIQVIYDEDGGSTKDGLIELRPGAKDLDMGKANYAQVRIAVDGTHYLKGMAVYNSDLPKGVDIRFNTNKKKEVGKKGAMKEMDPDPENPFGAYIKQGGQRGALNIVNETGDLAKQDRNLIKTQLDLTYERRRKELDSILELNNPSVKRKLLEGFADDTDSAAVHLRAAARPKQSTKVIIPVNDVKPTEVYAPTLRNGDRVALVRFPHGGRFEIPELTVNNRTPQAQKLIGNKAIDAIGINHKVAEHLSGADFDGDTVLVIPNNRREVKSDPALQGLKDFDPRSAYPAYPGMKRISESTKQNEMGKVSNLITDMTVRGANSTELAAAVRHSMVVIDSEKHNLDYKSSERDNGIPALKKKYQGKERSGASTLLSRANAKVWVDKMKPRPAAEGGPIDRATGKKVFVPTGQQHVNRKGETVTTKERRRGLSLVDDAHALSSGTPEERIYADHSNRLKAMGNEARKAMVSTPNTPYSPSAKKVYSNEVASLNSKLEIAQKNAPLERQAQALANSTVAARRRANPGMEREEIKKISRQALEESRYRTGAHKKRIIIEQPEWDAIQAGAISSSKLDAILRNADADTVRKLATPKTALKMTNAKAARAQAMLARGFTQAEVADQLGVSLSTLKVALSEG
jgi:DNA-binding CsgD family transcriptional regulator